MAEKPFTIRNDEQLKAALDRAEALKAGDRGAEGERELAKISEAVKVYTDSMRVLRNVPGDGESRPTPKGAKHGAE